MSDPDKVEPGKADAEKAERPFNALPDPEREKTSAPRAEAPGRRRWLDLPEGALGFFVLLLLAAASGGLIAAYWPWITGAGPENTALADRVSALESRVGQIAAGHAPEAVAGSFDTLQRRISELKDRLDADEARLTAVEKQNTATAAPDVTALKAALDKNSSDIAQLGQQMDKLAQGAGPAGTAPPQLSAKLAGDEKAMAALRSDVEARAKATADALDKLGGRIAALEKTAPPADLAERLDSLASKAAVDTLGSRVGKLEERDVVGLLRRAASVLALADLMRASAGSEPFANELDALRALTPNAPELADLAKYAGKGVPTMSMLTARFKRRLDSILAAERMAGAHNWLERLWAEIVEVVSVRRLGDVAGNDTEARLARAEFALDHGDLAAAVGEVKGLDAPAGKAAAPWLGEAEARLAVNRDARALTARIVAGLAAQTPAGSAP